MISRICSLKVSANFQNLQTNPCIYVPQIGVLRLGLKNLNSLKGRRIENGRGSKRMPLAKVHERRAFIDGSILFDQFSTLETASMEHPLYHTQSTRLWEEQALEESTCVSSILVATKERYSSIEQSSLSGCFGLLAKSWGYR